MQSLYPKIVIPELELQYIVSNRRKLFRIRSTILDSMLVQKLQTGEIRMQLWLERELRKQNGRISKRHWFHSRNNSNNAPSLLFPESVYSYGGGMGWGWKTISEVSPPYSTTNGYVPTEFEVKITNIIEGHLVIDVDIADIFTNILKVSRYGRFPVTGDSLELLSILARNRTNSQPIRFRLAININGEAMFSEPSNALNLKILKTDEIFDSNEILRYMQISYF